MVRLEGEQLFEAPEVECLLRDTSIFAAAKCIEAVIWWGASSRPAIAGRTSKVVPQYPGGCRSWCDSTGWEATECVMYLVFNIL